MNLIEIQREIIATLFADGAFCRQLRELPGTLVDKWQFFLEKGLPIQCEVLARHGLPADQQGLSAYNERMTELARTDPQARALNDQFWNTLFKEGFGIDTLHPLTLEQARHIIADMVDAMGQETFLSQVRTTAEQLKGEPLATIRKALLAHLIPLHIAVTERHGFAGEAGYLQVRRALMEHYADPDIHRLSNEATHRLFAAANLT